MPSSHLILCRPLLLLPSFFTGIRVFSSESALCFRWPKYWSFSFSLSLPHFKKVFVYFWLRWVFVAARRLPLVVVSRGCSLAVVEDSFFWWLLLGTRTRERADFRGCGTQAWLLRGTQNPPGPGIEPASPALAGKFLATGPPGKPPQFIFIVVFFFKLFYPSLT